MDPEQPAKLSLLVMVTSPSNSPAFTHIDHCTFKQATTKKATLFYLTKHSKQACVP